MVRRDRTGLPARCHGRAGWPKAEGERRKLLDAYYADAIDVVVLKAEQARISSDVRSVEERLAAVDTHLAEAREILGLAMRFATNCGGAYKRAGAKARRLFNQAVVRRIEVRTGGSQAWSTRSRSTCSSARPSSNTGFSREDTLLFEPRRPGRATQVAGESARRMKQLGHQAAGGSGSGPRPDH